jgi:hypothetical protein
LRRVAANSFALWHRTNHGDVGKDSGWGLRDVTSGESDSGFLGRVQKAIEKLISPTLGKIAGHGQRQERSKGFASHCSYVGKSSGEASVSDRVCRVPLAAKVHTFEGEIRGHQSLIAGSCGEDCAIVSNGFENSG